MQFVFPLFEVLLFCSMSDVLPHNTVLIDAEFSSRTGKRVKVNYSHQTRLVLLSRFGLRQFDCMSKGHMNTNPAWYCVRSLSDISATIKDPIFIIFQDFVRAKIVI